MRQAQSQHQPPIDGIVCGHVSSVSTWRHRASLAVFLVGALAVLVSACAPKVEQIEAQESCGFQQNVYGQRLTWPSGSSVGFHVHSSVPSQYFPAIEKAMQTWNAALGRRLFFVAGYNSSLSTVAARRDGVNLISLQSAWAGPSQQQAQTTTSWRGKDLVEADVVINGRDFSYFVDGGASQGRVHMESLLLHELGHALGLSHFSGERQQVMFPDLDSGTTRNQLSKAEVQSLQCGYGG